MATGHKGFDVRQKKRTVIVEFQLDDLNIILQSLALHNADKDIRDATGEQVSQFDKNHATWIADRVMRARDALLNTKTPGQIEPHPQK